jgi:hypothetical protein
LFKPTIARIAAGRERLAGLRQKGAAAGLIQGAEETIALEATQLTPFLYAYIGVTCRGFLSSIEDDRLNKQIGTAANAAGTTSVVSKGSVPALFGFAVENGALTRDISGTTITFRGSPGNIYAAFLRNTYLEAGPAVPPLDGTFESLAKRASFYASFDASRGNPNSTTTTPSPPGEPVNLVFTGDRQQLAGYGVRYEIINRRDPRREEYQPAIEALINEVGLPFITQLTAVIQRIEMRRDLASVAALDKWRNDLSGRAVKAATDDEVRTALVEAVDAFKTVADQLILDVPELRGDMKRAVDAAEKFYDARNLQLVGIMKSFTAAVEYNFVSQSNTGGTVTTAMGAKVPLPDIGNVTFVASKGFLDGPEFTFNAGAAWFQSIPAGLTTKSLRDIRASGQLDFPLPRIQNIGKPVFAIAAQFLSLREEALGARVQINGLDVTTKGNIGLVQAKLVIPTKGAVSFPLSVTWANRTELIKEKEVRANIGVTFDFDKLFAKP